MIRLTVAIGFLAVFGVVAYALVVLLTKVKQEETTNTKEDGTK